MRLDELLSRARGLGCSDVHLTRGLPPIARLHGSLMPLREAGLLGEEAIGDLIAQLGVGARGMEDQDFAYVSADGFRHRVNLYRQQDSPAVAIRLLAAGIPTLEELRLPPVMADIASLPQGLVLVTGPTGSGKSTTLAAMIDRINTTRSCHILTLEDPIEYLHTHKKCMVNQREIGRDAASFGAALRSALREDPDVILVGEMRDLETIAAAITAAETGHLVLSTLHTTGAASTVDRIIDVFEPYQQQQIRTQLSGVLRAVVSQQLVPTAGHHGRVAALEIMIATDAIANMIREAKTHQIPTALQTGAKVGMQSLDSHLATLVRSGQVDMADALQKCMDAAMLQRLAHGI